MRLKVVYLGLIVSGLCLAMPSGAQEGHPLTGTWFGEWGPESDRRQVTMVMFWDGTEVTGIMDPGPYSASIDATLDSSEWTVHIEAIGTDAAGDTVTYVADGTVEDAGSRSRSISGTWQTGNANSRFTISRED
jgi:hypothetical protein